MFNNPRPSTPAERTVIYWVVILGCLGLGLGCVYLGWSAPADKLDDALQLRRFGYVFVGFVAVALVLRWAIRLWLSRD